MIPTLIPPIRPATSLSDLTAALSVSGDTELFETELRNASGKRTVEFFGSGRAALTQFLKRIESGQRDEVVIPAYTCWSVAASVVRAGLRVRLIDLDLESLHLDPAALRAIPWSGVRAIVLTHLFGRALEIERLCAEIRRFDPAVTIIEDAAQAWVDRDSRAANAVLLSFGRGKPMCLGAGGVMLHDLPPAGAGRIRRGSGAAAWAKLLATLELSRPALFRLPASLPFLGIGETTYDTRYSLEAGLYRWQLRLAARQLPSLASLSTQREQNSRRLSGELKLPTGWTVLGAGRIRGTLRLPLLAPDRPARDRALQEIRRAGVAGSPMYPLSLSQLTELNPHRVDLHDSFPSAEALADRLLTLPVYPGLAGHQLDRIATIVSSHLASEEGR